MIDALILIGFAGWILATAIYQLELGTPLRRLEWCGFIPDCRFFCPHPAMTDLQAYYARSADATGDGHALVWRSLVEQDLPRALPLWNPQVRLRRSAGKLISSLLQIREAIPSGAPYSVPYLRLLNLAANAGEGSAEPFLRFIVTEHRGRASAERLILFESRTHAR
jgi:hypothetical protein